MVVLAAAVCTKTGKALFSRQFVEISRVRIEGLLAAFPKLMSGGKQHTFIETENVRYLYQPLENLYMLILTNKSSNILEDLDTLHLLAKIVPEYCRVLDEAEVSAKVFELIFAFDEVIAVGYKEKVTLQQIKLFMEMDSHEERIHEMLERNKRKDAEEEANRKRIEIEKMRKEQKARGLSPSPAWSPTPTAISSTSSTPEPVVVAPKEKRSSSVGLGSTGMVLGKKEGTTSKFMKALEHEEDIKIVERSPNQLATSGGTSMATAPNESIVIDVVENVSVVMDNDGILQKFDVRGDLTLTIHDAQYASAILKLVPSDRKGFVFKSHPKIDKNRFTKENILALKSGSYPTGSTLNVMKWRYQSTEESQVPLTVNCWPTPDSDGRTVVNMEYELQDTRFSLGNVCISIPIIGGAPVVGDVQGAYDFDVKNHVLHWKLDLIDEASNTGAMEFTTSKADRSAFLPIHVSFVSQNTFCDINVGQVLLEDNQSVAFAFTKSLHSDEYEVVSS